MQNPPRTVERELVLRLAMRVRAQTALFESDPRPKPSSAVTEQLIKAELRRAGIRDGRPESLEFRKILAEMRRKRETDFDELREAA
jgi:hypothetical protein